jgi:hypothetical protein
MWQSYRDEKASTFYYIFDKKRPFEDPLHMVVFDAVDPQYAKQQGYNAPVELTDKDNTTGKISEFGNDFQAYIDYLKKNGVPVEKMMHEPHTKEEKLALALLGSPNESLEWFKSLGKTYKEMADEKGYDIPIENVTQLTYKLMSQYIGRGHRLSKDQWNYLWNLRKTKAAEKLIDQYLNTGIAIPEYQFEDLTAQ